MEKKETCIYNLVFENSEEMIIWKVEMKISIKLEGITGTLKLRVPEYNIPFDVEYIYGFV